MGAYNRVNGEPCCGSKRLLQDILRDEFGFKGYVVSDCAAICDFHQHHHVTQNAAESAALAVKSGCELNCGNTYKWLKTAVALDLISEETITHAVEKLFYARFRLGMFDSDCPYDTISYDVVESPKHTALNLKMAEESIVLLKNDGILPLSDTQNIAVIGPLADDASVLLGNYNGTPSRYTTLLAGIQNQAKGKVWYARGCHLFDATIHEWAERPLREAILAARRADVVILICGLNPSLEGEECDDYNGSAGGDKADINLPPSQQQLYEAIIQTGKPVVFVNVSGSCIALPDQDKKCRAVVQCFYPGAEGGTALANILFGKTSPSGRLPVTFYKSTDDLPPFADYSMENRTYKFFSGTPLYPFGHGLSYSEIIEEPLENNCVRLTNNGPYDTAYTALQFEYIPHKNLRAFKKVFLKKGESVTLCFDAEEEEA